jgi:predicted porin
MYQAGFQVGFGGGWAVGASGQYVVHYLGAGYNNNFNFATTGDDAYMITAGGSYTVDAISVGLEGLFNNYSTSGVNTSGHQRYYGASLNAAYALGPGISLEGQVAWTKSSNNFDPNDNFNVNAYEFDIGTAINF